MKKIIHVMAVVTAVCVSLACLDEASASNLIFQGQNAGLFPGANPADTSDLMNSVVKPNNPNATSANTTTSLLVQQAVASQLSTEIYNTILASGSSTSGEFFTGDGGTIQYSRDGSGNLTVIITSPDGTVTTLGLGDLH